jgi:hypothetical protein
LLAHVRPLVEVGVARIRLDTDKPHRLIAPGTRRVRGTGGDDCSGLGLGM